jgi:ankyrin repeat protein
MPDASIPAFFAAIRDGNVLAVDTALGADATIVRARDTDGSSTVAAAMRAGQPKMAERFAARLTATPDGLDIFDAASVGNVATIRTLLNNDRADVDLRGMDGYGPLHLAAEFGQVEVVRLLSGRGADPNAVSMNDERATPLHRAIAGGRRDTASLLLALGASPNSVERGGVTVLHAAARRGDEAIVDMLLLRGADASRRNDEGKTPADLACDSGHAALGRLLETAARR